jgi:V8-like Glu-specific endopeptidase
MCFWKSRKIDSESQKDLLVEFEEIDIRRLDIPNGLDEELHCPQNDKYLVPIFAENGVVYRGNGVIVGKYLITAAHVAQSEHEEVNYSELCFWFEGQPYPVSDKDIVFDGRGKEDENGVHKDLIVYKLDEFEGNFVCNEEEINEGLTLFSYPYNKYDESVKFSGGNCSIVSKEVRSGRDNNEIWKNCFKVNYPWRIGPGNSGSPVFVKNVIYGILIEKYEKGDGAYGKVLDARYIKSVIDEYESRTN